MTILTLEDEEPVAALSLQDGSTNLVPPEPVVDQRVQKADYALGDNSPGKDVIRTSIMSGDEQGLRRKLADDEDLQNEALRQEIIKQLAISNGGQLSPEDIQTVQSLSASEVRSDPATILEKKFSDRYMASVLSRMADEADMLGPVGKEADIASTVATELQWQQKEHEDYETRWGEVGWGSWTANHAAQLIPFLPWWRQEQALSERPGHSWLFGQSVSDNVKYMWTLPPEERRRVYKDTMERLWATNPVDALTFSQAMVAFPASEEYLGNTMSIADFTGLGAFGAKFMGKLFGRGKAAVPDPKDPLRVANEINAGEARVLDVSEIQAMRAKTEGLGDPKMLSPERIGEIRVALADAVKALGEPKLDPEAVLSHTGNIEAAGFLGAIKRLINPVHNRGLEGIASEVPTMANPWKFFESSKVLGRERAQRLADEMGRQADAMALSFVKAGRPSRMTPEALAVAKAGAEAAIRKQYTPRLRNGLLDFEYVPATMHPANVDTLIGWVGKNDATLPASKAEAQMWAKGIYQLQDSEYILRQQGTNWKIGVFKHLDETSEQARKAMDVEGNRTNGGIINMLLERLTNGIGLRSAADQLSPFQMEQRHLATHAPQEVRAVLREIIDANIYKALNWKHRGEVEAMLKMNRDMPSKRYPGERGRWFDNAAEFEMEFQAKFGKPPTEKQIVAYDTFKRVSDFEWVIRNTEVYRDKARQGVENVRFTTADGKTPDFEAIPMDGIPWHIPRGDQDAGIWVYNAKTKKGEYYYKFDMSDEQRDLLNNMIANEGYRVVKVFEPTKHPLEGIAHGKSGPINDQINYVVSNTFERSPLSWKQVDYRPGGHSIYAHPWYVAQPVIREGRGGKSSFFGDNNVLNIRTEAQAKMWAERLDKARELIKLGKTDEVEAYRAANLPWTSEQLYRMFKGKDAPLSLDHPIVYKEADRSTLDTIESLKKWHKEGGLIDTRKNIHDPSAAMDKSYLAERDNVIKTIRDDGGIYRLEDAEQLDPYDAMNRGMSQALRNVWMTDYKLQAAESFIAEFSDVLRPSAAQLRANPLFWLHNPEWNENVRNQARLTAAKANHRAVVQFLGTKNDLEKGLDYIGSKVLSSIYNTTGERGVRYVDAISLTKMTDPVSFMRGVAFHSKLGFFNPVQLFVQMQTMTHTVAVAGPRHGLPGVAAGVLASIAYLNPKMVPHIAKKAKAFGWKTSDFEEMFSLIESSGVSRVGGEAMLRNTLDNPIYRKGAEAFLDKGSMFFNGGERLARLSAFATAYREFKAANKGVEITDRELGKIMARMSTLSADMTRAAAAGWQHGILSVPTQFFAFNARLLEQMVGKRLTGAEKIRALTTHAAVYGVPVSAGIVTMGTSPLGMFGLPTSYEDVKEEAMKRGIDLSPKYLEFLSNGGMSMLLHWATGKEYNTAARYGPGASTALSTIMREDKTPLEIALGASGTILGDIWKTSYPLQHAAASVFGGDTKAYPLKASDWWNLFRNISSVDTAAKMHAVIAYGQWITKTGTVVDDKAEGIDAAMAFFGLTSMKVTETYTGINAVKEFKESQKPLVKDAIQSFRLGIQAGANQDYTGLEQYFTRARTAMEAADMTWEDKNTVFQAAVKQSGELAGKIDWKVVTELGAKGMPARLDQFIKKGN